MRTYSGRLWLVQDPQSEVGVEVSLDQERIKITSNGTVIGDWPFEEIDIAQRGDDIHLVAENEEIVISSSERGFTEAMVDPGGVDRESSGHIADTPASVEAVARDDTTAEVEDDRSEGTRKRKRSRRGAHRRPWSLKLRW